MSRKNRRAEASQAAVSVPLLALPCCMARTWRSTASPMLSTASSLPRGNAAGLGISVVPFEVPAAYSQLLGIQIIALTAARAQRRFIVCFKSFDSLQPAAQRMVDHLANRASMADVSALQ